MYNKNIVLILMVFISIFFVDIIHSSEINQQSPEFKFITLDGDTVKSDDLKGKVILLDFWNTGCIPCRKAMPKLEKLYKKYKDNSNVAIFILNSGWEPIEKARKFANKKRASFIIFNRKKYDLPFAYDLNSTTFKSFGFNANPSTVIIDQNFIIRYKQIGVKSGINIFQYLTKQIDELLERKGD